MWVVRCEVRLGVSVSEATAVMEVFRSMSDSVVSAMLKAFCVACEGWDFTEHRLGPKNIYI